MNLSISKCLYLCEDFKKQWNDSSISYMAMVKLTGNLKKDKSFLNSLNYKIDDDSNNEVIMRTPLSGYVQMVETKGPVTNISWIAFGILFSFSILASIGLYNSNVKDLEVDLGIIKSMGGCRKTIISIVSLQTFAIATFQFIITLIGDAIFNTILNKLLFLRVFRFNIIVVLAVFAILYVFSTIVSFIFSIKALNQRPINTIENK